MDASAEDVTVSRDMTSSFPTGLESRGSALSMGMMPQTKALTPTRQPNFRGPPATAAHIHKTPATEPGPVVVPLAPSTSGSSSGTVQDVARELANEIMQDPGNYYVNVHNSDYRDGALRGQLSK